MIKKNKRLQVFTAGIFLTFISLISLWLFIAINNVLGNHEKTV